MRNLSDNNRYQTNVDIIIVTYDNIELVERCLKSVHRYTAEPFRLIVVNNGNAQFSVLSKNCHVINTGKNLGWMGGVNAGIKWAQENSPSPFVLWMNDDTQVLDHDYGWLPRMIKVFELDEKIGAVGPSSNAVMGFQSIQHQGLPQAFEATRLSGMCFLTKHSIVKEIGYLDESLPGGDDLDYSIRLTKSGYKLGVCRRTFLLHHYAATGKKVHGDYWDSREHTEASNCALIKKHGFKEWFKCVNDVVPAIEKGEKYDFIAHESELAMKELKEILDNGGKVLDLGCGGKKIDPRVVGVDIRANGEFGVGYNASIPSAADVESEVTKLPFEDSSIDGILAKHLFEHIEDVVEALREWGRVLKNRGRLVIVCPDPRYCQAISCDPSHLHAFTPKAIESLLEVTGFYVDRSENVRPGYVGVVSARKVPVREIAKCAY